MTQPASRSPRDHRLDFFRGCALVFIFIDHIPDNMLSNVTLRSFAFCDAAEVFIFISGYTAALVYGRTLLREGRLMASVRIWRRVWQLYLAHLVLFMLYTAQVVYTVRHFNNPLFTDELRVGEFLDQPYDAFLNAVLLKFQPSLLNILPLYVALLLAFPVFLIAISVHPLLALVPSALLYGAVQIWHVNLPGYPEDTEWFFDPFAWQFLFVIAASFGFAAARGRSSLPAGRRIAWPAIAIAAAGLVLMGSDMLHGTLGLPILWNIPVWVIDKTSLPPLRLASVLALASLVSLYIPKDAAFLTSRPAWPLVLCGRNSLEIFGLTILLSALCSTLLTLAGRGAIIQLAVNLAGIVVIFAIGFMMAWYDGGGRLPERPGGTVRA
jgi:hypothetical protein